jgi:hypothetical protein
VALEPVEVIANGHSERQQLLERLLWLVKGYGDLARLEPDTRGEALELLRQDLNWRFHQKLRPFPPVLLQLRQDFGNVAPAPPLIVAVVAPGDAAQMGDEGIPIGQAVGADTLGDAGSEDLLGSAAADAEQEFEGGAVDERPGQALEFADDVV